MITSPQKWPGLIRPLAAGFDPPGDSPTRGLIMEVQVLAGRQKLKPGQGDLLPSRGRRKWLGIWFLDTLLRWIVEEA